ncbi:MAG: diguanylate cyclase domain-containing protein [Acidimicrobiales bacterium]
MTGGVPAVPGPLPEPERAVSFFRILVSATAMVMVVADGAADQRAVGGGMALLSAGLVMVALGAWSALPPARARLSRRSVVASQWAVQLFDIAFFIALAVLADSVVDQTAWAALTFPLLFAGLRFGPSGVFGSWALTLAGIWVLGELVTTGAADDAGTGAGPAAVDAAGDVFIDLAAAPSLQRSAPLLVFAAAMALLSGWLKEGWLEQADVQRGLDLRQQRLMVIEDAARAIGSPRTDPEPTRLDFIVDLGFSTATAGHRDSGRSWRWAGDATILPPDRPTLPADAQVEITRWFSEDDRGRRPLYSASVLDPRLGTALTGWSPSPIDDNLAQALADLTARTAGSVTEATTGQRSPANRSPAGGGKASAGGGGSPAGPVCIGAPTAAVEEPYVPAPPLAGLADRWELEHAVELVSSHNGPIAVLMIDLDDFKSISYTRGRSLGNEAMIGIARRLQRAVGNEGLAARYGEDEFVVVLTGEAARVAPGFAERLVAHLARPIRLSSMVLEAKVTIGVAVAHGPINTNLLRHTAARASFEAKAAGRGGCFALRCERRGRTTRPEVGRSTDRRPPTVEPEIDRRLPDPARPETTSRGADSTPILTP